EKLTLRRFEVKTKSDNGAFGEYLHMGGRIAVLTVIEGSTDENIAKDVAMHIAAINPKYVSRDQVSEEETEHERQILTQQAVNESKRDNIFAIMGEDRLKKFIKEICLLDQSFDKNPDQKVRQFVETSGTEVVVFTRYEVRE